VWQLNASNAIAQLPSLAYTDGALQTTVPGQSVTLFILPPSSALRLAIGAPISNGQFGFSVSGEIGRSFILQSSADLSHWSSISTNTLSGTDAAFQLSAGARTQFYRAVLSH
jgi:hypothetical protein